MVVIFFCSIFLRLLEHYLSPNDGLVREWSMSHRHSLGLNNRLVINVSLALSIAFKFIVAQASGVSAYLLLWRK